MKRKFLGLLFFLTLFFFFGCSSKFRNPHGEEFIAIVNGYPIGMDEFKKKLGDYHNIKDLGEKLNVNLAVVDYQRYLDELIDERLMIQEGKNIGFSGIPDYEGSYKYAKANLALELLKADEILNKINVTEEEIRKDFDLRTESVKMFHLFTTSKEKGETLLKRLKGGEEFGKLVVEESEDPPSIKDAKGDIGSQTRGDLADELKEPAFSLKPGEISDLIKTEKGYHIIRVGEREYIKEIESHERDRIYKRIYNEKFEIKEKEFQESLKKNAKIEIYEDVIAKITSEKLNGKENFSADDVIASVDGTTIKAGELHQRLVKQNFSKIESGLEDAKKHILENLIRQTLIDNEVEKKNYEADLRFKKAMELTEDILYKKFFTEIIIAENVVVNESEAETYYKEHQDEFLLPFGFNLRAIVVRDQNYADELKREVLKGADFGTVAKEVSIDSSAKNRGDVGILTEENLSSEIKAILKAEPLGGVVGPFNTADGFLLLKLEGKTDKKVKDFSNVKDEIIKKLKKGEYKKTLAKYVEDLRKTSDIYTNQKLLQRYTESKKMLNK